MRSLAIFSTTVVFMGMSITAYAIEAARAPANEASRSPAAAESYISMKLKAALAETKPKLGELEAWQLRIFDEEAIPQYQRFIRDYRSLQAHSGTAARSIVADIDLTTLKNYLRFYAPKVLKREIKDSTVLVYLAPGADCAKCTEAEPALRKQVAERLDRRGFKPIWLSAKDLAVPTTANAAPVVGELKGKALEAKVMEIAAARGTAAGMVLQWALSVPDDVDSAHADEKHYRIQSLLAVRAGSSTVSSEGHLDILENDAFENASSRLLTDAFTEMGVQAQKIEMALNGVGADDSEVAEIAVRLSGIRDFAQLTRVKAQLQNRLPDAVIEERKVSRGKVELAVQGEKSLDKIKRAIAGSVSSPEDSGIQSEVQQ